MIKHLLFTAALVAGLASAVNAAETVVFTETFESYADQAALELTWTPSVAGAVVLGNVAGTGAEASDKFVTLASASAATLTRTMPSVTFTPSDVDPISVSAYLRAADWANSRSGVSVRDASFGGAILHVGTTNAATANAAGGTGDKFALRLVGYGTNPSASGYWALLGGISRPVNTWTKIKATSGATSVKAYINDVNVPADDITTITAAPTAAFSAVRIGLGVTTNKDVNVDSIVVSTGTGVSDAQDWDLYN